MKHIISCMAIALFGICIATAQPTTNSIAGNSHQNIEPTAAIRLSYFTASKNNERVMMNWAMENNKEADRFEVERSTDGKNFKIVALLFGSEDSGIAEYRFFEKAKKEKMYYRLRISYKSGKVDYSDILMP